MYAILVAEKKTAFSSMLSPQVWTSSKMMRSEGWNPGATPMSSWNDFENHHVFWSPASCHMRDLCRNIVTPATGC